MLKRIATAICALAVVVPVNAYAESAFSGIWGGLGTQDNGSVWSVIVTIGSGGGDAATIDYPSIPCAGYLTADRQGPRSASFKEHITFNTERCIDNGRVELHAAGGEAVYYRWYYPSGKLGAETELRKYATESAARDAVSRRFAAGACDHVYAGRSFMAPGGPFRISQEYVVEGVSPASQRVTIRSRISGGRQEVTCSDIPR